VALGQKVDTPGLSNSSRPVVAELFDPRAEFAIAWPLEGRIQCDLRDRQHLMLLHCCPQLETWCLKKCGRYLVGRITPDVDYEEKW